MGCENDFFRIVRTEADVTTILEICEERTVRPISDASILKTSDESVTVKVKNGSVLRIGDYFYIWDAEKKVFEIQC